MKKIRKIMQLFSQKNDTVMAGQTNIDRSQSTRQTGSHNSQARWFALSTKFGMTKRYAFTLAEVLITLGIIGVVAAITLPAFMENVNSRVKAKRMENIHQKLSKVTDKMASLDVLGGHASTEEFITEMKKHMNIAKVCENGELAKCWPTSTVTIDDGKTFEISQATSGKTLKASTEKGEDWDKTMGIVTADGTSMIISYNKNCRYDANTQGLNFDHASGMSSTLTSGCLAIVYDWNGGSRPNKLSEDVIAIGKAGGLGTACAYKTQTGLCIREAAHEVAKPLTKAECEAQKSTLGITNCYSDYDYWAAAVAECGGTIKMFNESELEQIAFEVYGVSSRQGLYERLTFNSDKAATLGLPSSTGFTIWSSEEVNDDFVAYDWTFNDSSSSWGGNHRDFSGFLVLCKGE